MFNQLTVNTAKEKISQEDFIILDVRDIASYLNGHLPKARLLTHDNLAEFLQHSTKQQPVLVCCYHGISSQKVAEFLVSEGFKNIYNLEGGFTAWQQIFPDHIEYGETP